MVDSPGLSRRRLADEFRNLPLMQVLQAQMRNLRITLKRNQKNLNCAGRTVIACLCLIVFVIFLSAFASRTSTMMLLILKMLLVGLSMLFIGFSAVICILSLKCENILRQMDDVRQQLLIEQASTSRVTYQLSQAVRVLEDTRKACNEVRLLKIDVNNIFKINRLVHCIPDIPKDKRWSSFCPNHSMSDATTNIASAHYTMEDSTEQRLQENRADRNMSENDSDSNNKETKPEPHLLETYKVVFKQENPNLFQDNNHCESSNPGTSSDNKSIEEAFQNSKQANGSPYEEDKGVSLNGTRNKKSKCFDSDTDSSESPKPSHSHESNRSTKSVRSKSLLTPQGEYDAHFLNTSRLIWTRMQTGIHRPVERVTQQDTETEMRMNQLVDELSGERRNFERNIKSLNRKGDGESDACNQWIASSSEEDVDVDEQYACFSHTRNAAMPETRHVSRPLPAMPASSQNRESGREQDLAVRNLQPEMESAVSSYDPRRLLGNDGYTFTVSDLGRLGFRNRSRNFNRPIYSYSYSYGRSN